MFHLVWSYSNFGKSVLDSFGKMNRQLPPLPTFMFLWFIRIVLATNLCALCWLCVTLYDVSYGSLVYCVGRLQAVVIIVKRTVRANSTVTSANFSLHCFHLLAQHGAVHYVKSFFMIVFHNMFEIIFLSACLIHIADYLLPLSLHHFTSGMPEFLIIAYGWQTISRKLASKQLHYNDYQFELL